MTQFTLVLLKESEFVKRFGVCVCVYTHSTIWIPYIAGMWRSDDSFVYKLPLSALT